MERDPHQLIEGILIACYAVGLHAGVPLRPRRDGPRAGAHRGRPQRGVRGGLHRRQHPRHRLLARHRPALGRRRLHRRRGDGAHREPRGQPGHAPPQAAVLPGRQGPLPAADDRQQRRDAGQPAVDPLQRRFRVRRARRRDEPGHPHVRGVRPRAEPRRVRGRVRGHHLPRPALPRRPTPAACAPGHELKAFIPGGASAPWFFPEHLDLPLEAGAVGKAGSMLGLRRDRRDGRHHRHGEGGAADRALLRPRVVRQVHAVPRGHQLAREDPASASSTATAGPSDLDLLLDVCDNISPSIAWPPKQTTICPLGPSAVSPIASAVMRFRDEFEAKIGGPPR